jgi:hypothetical protein
VSWRIPGTTQRVRDPPYSTIGFAGTPVLALEQLPSPRAGFKEEVSDVSDVSEVSEEKASPQRVKAATKAVRIQVGSVILNDRRDLLLGTVLMWLRRE